MEWSYLMLLPMSRIAFKKCPLGSILFETFINIGVPRMGEGYPSCMSKFLKMPMRHVTKYAWKRLCSLTVNNEKYP